MQNQDTGNHNKPSCEGCLPGICCLACGLACGSTMGCLAPFPGCALNPVVQKGLFGALAGIVGGCAGGYYGGATADLCKNP